MSEKIQLVFLDKIVLHVVYIVNDILYLVAGIVFDWYNYLVYAACAVYIK